MEDDIVDILQKRTHVLKDGQVAGSGLLVYVRVPFVVCLRVFWCLVIASGKYSMYAHGSVLAMFSQPMHTV